MVEVPGKERSEDSHIAVTQIVYIHAGKGSATKTVSAGEYTALKISALRKHQTKQPNDLSLSSVRDNQVSWDRVVGKQCYKSGCLSGLPISKDLNHTPGIV